MYKVFLTLRYLRKRRIAYFAIAAVTLCVMMVLVVRSIMGGWLDQVKVRARGLLGDVVVDNQRFSGMPLYQEFIDQIKEWPEVVEATPVIYTYGLFQIADTTWNGMVRVVGIRLDEVFNVNAFRESLFYEKFYPGTTTLGEQQQPVVGVDPQSPRMTIKNSDLDYIRPALPAQYMQALAKSGTDPVKDDDSTETMLNELLRRAGLSPFPGVYDGPVGPGEPPQMIGNPLPGIILGRDIIAKRISNGKYSRPEAVPRGCKVILTIAQISTEGEIEVPPKQVFRYADDSRTGIFDIDSQHVYCGFDVLQQLTLMGEDDRIDPETLEVVGKHPARCSQIQIKVRPGMTLPEIEALCDSMEAVYHGLAHDPQYELDSFEARLVSVVDAMTWQQSQAHIIGPVEKEKNLVTILFGIISLVAVTLVLCILYMIVLQKTRDIGIIKSIGGSSAGVATIFIFYGVAVGVVGSVIGSVGGVLFVTYINEIQDFLIGINPAWRVWDMEVYSFDRIPSQVAPLDLAVVTAIAIAASTLGAVAAALRAGFMEPVRALGYE